MLNDFFNLLQIKSELESGNRKRSDSSTQKSRHIQMVWKLKEKLNTKPVTKAKKRRARVITNISSNGGDVLIFETISAKNLNHGL